MKSLLKAALAFLFMFALSTVAMAALPVIPEGDTVAQIVQLVTQWKVIGPVGAGIIIVTLLAQVVKHYVGESMKYKRLLVVLLSTIYSVLIAVAAGVGVLPAILATLVTSGGAMALYEAAKGAGLIKSKAKELA